MSSVGKNQQLFIRLRLSLLFGGLIALVLIGLWAGNSFMNARQHFMDIYYAPAPTSGQVVIVTIDDNSLARYGSRLAEWPRAVYTDLVNRLLPANPRVLAFDLIFGDVKPDDEAFANALSSLRQNDARTRVVIADAGINNVTLKRHAVPSNRVFAFASDVSLSPAILEQSDYRGYTNTVPDMDGIVRRQPSLLMVNNRLEYAFSLAVYLANLRVPAAAAAQVVTSENDSLRVTANRTLAVDEYGFWQSYFFDLPVSSGGGAFRVVSLIDVVDGNFDEALFEDKIVLVGLANATGLLEQYPVPSATTGGLMAGVEIQAHAIESLVQNKFFKPLPNVWQGILIVGLALLSAALFATMRWYFKILLLLGMVLLWIVIASLVFSTTLLAISLFDTLLALAIPFVFSLGIDISLERRQRKRQEFLLDSLHQIAQQRLRIEQAANYILNDIQSVIPDARSTLYLRDETQPQGCLVYKPSGFNSSSELDAAALKRYLRFESPQTQSRQTVFPFVWQNRTNGFLLIRHPDRNRLPGQAEQFIRDFVKQLAPNIDNMLLYHTVERQKQLLDSVFAESPVSIAVMNAEGVIVQHNAHLARLLSSPEADLKGQSLLTRFSESAGSDDLLEQLQDGLKKGRAFSVPEVRTGAYVVRLDAAPLRPYDLWIVTISDVTSLVELSHLKTQLLRLAAHDLKNPLARIMGYTELLLLQFPNLEENHQSYLKVIRQATQDMSNIINDILNLERLRSGQPTLTIIDFVMMIREICDHYQPDVIQKKQTFNKETPIEPIYVKADLSQLSQAVTNLIGNAIKYTPDYGVITVRIQEHDSLLRFEVEDTGYGIPKAAQAKLFTEFFRAKTTATAHIPGTGLGLNLARMVIEAHGGTIGFTSEEGVGSTFYFTLPVVVMESQPDV